MDNIRFAKSLVKIAKSLIAAYDNSPSVVTMTMSSGEELKDYFDTIPQDVKKRQVEKWFKRGEDTINDLRMFVQEVTSDDIEKLSDEEFKQYLIETF